MQTEPPRNGTAPLQQSFEDRRLRRAVEHVNALWFPANPTAVAKVRASLEEGRYDFGMDFLLEDLKQDLALYLYCLRELAWSLRQDGVQPVLGSPIEFLKQAGLDRIKLVLDVLPGQISEHDLVGSAPYQTQQFEASIVSAATAELLAAESMVVPEQAHLTALVRHLGLILIAWNYSSAFEKAMSELTAEKSLDAALSEILGFSPSALAVAVMNDWGLSAETQAALVDDPAVEERDLPRQTGNHLARLCRIGEALARANRPDLYPSASSDWDHVRSELQNMVGPEVLGRIAEHVKEYCAEYRNGNPELFSDTVEIDPARQIRNHTERQLFQTNPFAQQCEPELRARFRQVYELRARAKDPSEALTYLVKNVLPVCGFSGTVVFTLDTQQLALLPRLKVGSLQIAAPQPLAAAPGSGMERIVARAYHGAGVIEERGEEGLLVAGRLGQQETMGVVCAQLEADVELQPERSLLRFKALQQAFNDVLGLV